MNKTKFQDFSNVYSISKTLRFELIPQGDTLEHIKANGFLKDDENLAENYKKVKKIIDRVHREFIEKSLTGFQVPLLQEYFEIYNIDKKDKDEQKAFTELQADMRKAISRQMTKDPNFKQLFKKELIRQDLFDYAQNDEEKAMILDFYNFTTYFTGFHDNRQNMYSEDDKNTSIAHRIVQDNLPIFIDNMKIFDKILDSDIAENFKTMETELSAFLEGKMISDYFTLENFSQTITQKGITAYNAILSGYVDPTDEKKKYRGLNEYINLFNQKAKQEKRNEHIGKLKKLKKQILSDTESISFLPESFTNSQEVLDAIREFHENNLSGVIDETSLRYILKNIGNYDLTKIYIRNDETLANISNKIFGRWDILQSALFAQYDATYTGKKKINTEKYEDERRKYLSNIDSYSISALNEALKFLPDEDKHKNIESYFANVGVTTGPDLIEKANAAYDCLEQLLSKPYPADKSLSQTAAHIDKIKTYLDSVKDIQRLVKQLLGSSKEPNKDENFYGDLNPIWNDLDKVTPLYNSIRNYVTKKPYKTDKIKLNFHNASLLSGWDVNQEPVSTAVLLMRDGNYYLGIVNKNHKKIFQGDIAQDGEVYHKVDYKQLQGAAKMMPKVFFPKKQIDKYGPSDEVLHIYHEKTFTKGDNFDINDCHKLIDYFKGAIKQYPGWNVFNYQFSDTKTYADISGFYREVEEQSYKLSFRDISKEYVDSLVTEGKLYLFQIYNKDFSPYSKGTPNLHTLYWKMLFDEQNLEDVVYKLNGGAEVFYRKATPGLKKTATHPKNAPITNKNPNNPKKESVFDYDLIKNKRYTQDKFQFNVNIKMNFKKPQPMYFNLKVRDFIKDHENTNVIGVHRGERNLLYLAVINGQGEILEQYSLNEIINEYNGVSHKTDYHELLNRKEQERDAARKNWQSIENIKDLKEGYLSQVINKIAQLIIKYEAIVVLEDLDFGFKQERQKVEKQIYQKFETMLINKLQYLADKKAPVDQVGGLLKAYQLTEVKTYGKQNGFIFFVPAWNTSNIDPTTGFVDLFRNSDVRYESIDQAKAFIDRIDDIRFNKNAGYFEFDIDFMNFNDRGAGTQTAWTICSYGDRIQTFRNPDKNNQWDAERMDITDKFRILFVENELDINSKTLKNDILRINKKAFYVEFFNIFRLMMQLRNRHQKSDFILSPVMNKNGEFFDSRENRPGFPENEDANGAYNIARKGLWACECIKDCPDEDLRKVKFGISNTEWLEYIQNNTL